MKDDEARARRCPRSILALWAWQAAVGLAVAWPAASLVREAYGADPRGDAVLWDAGAHPLLGLLARERHALAALTSEATLVLLGAALASVVATAALLAALSRAGAARPGQGGMARIGERAIRCLPPFAALLGGTLLAQGAVVAAAVFLGKVAGAVGEPSLGEARAHLMGGVVTGVVLLPVLALGVAHDLARAAVVASRASAGRAVVVAARTLARLPWALSWGWAWRALAGLALVGAGALAADALTLRGGAGLAALALVHQCVILGRVALRSSWLANALRAVDRAA